jgi:hypothetical protein
MGFNSGLKGLNDEVGKIFVLYSGKCIIYQTDVTTHTSAFWILTAVITSHLSALNVAT